MIQSTKIDILFVTNSSDVISI